MKERNKEASFLVLSRVRPPNFFEGHGKIQVSSYHREWVTENTCII